MRHRHQESLDMTKLGLASTGLTYCDGDNTVGGTLLTFLVSKVPPPLLSCSSITPSVSEPPCDHEHSTSLNLFG